MNMGKKVLITGKGGYISTNLEHCFLSNNYEVEIVDLLRHDWNRIYSFSGWDIIIHTAGLVHKNERKHSIEEYININAALSLEVAKKAKREGVHFFVFFSSESVFGLTPSIYKKVYINRKTETKPRTKYGISKLEGERLLSSLVDESFKLLILRPPMVYGDNCPGNYCFFKKFVLKFHVFPKIKTEKSLVNINQLCKLVYEYIQKETTGIMCPRDEKPYPLIDMADDIAKENNTVVFHSILLLGIVKCLGFIPIIKKAFGNMIITDDF